MTEAQTKKRPLYRKIGTLAKNVITNAEQEAYFETIDQFLGDWIGQLTPKELDAALSTKPDPREVWSVEGFRESAGSWIQWASAGSILTNWVYGKSVGDMIRQEITRDSLISYMQHAQNLFPDHYAVILAHEQDGSIEYLLKAVKMLLKDVID